MAIDRIKLPDNTVQELRDSTKQGILVSGENIKTINNESILGSGNITIEGGGGGDMSAYEVKANKVTTISASSTNEQYPSAKAVYDAIMSGGTVEEDIPDVIFIDYDGSVTNTYSRDDFTSLTWMPTNPTHTGLTSQGWNWTLADAKEYVVSHGRLVIGQMYITSDGKTRFGITINESTSDTVTFKLTGSGSVEIDWGDGSTETTTPQTHTHTYVSAGDYVISFSRTAAGNLDWFGLSNQNNVTLNGATLRWAHIGENISQLGSDTFKNCYNAEFITVPHGVTRFQNYAFNDCRALKGFVVPDTVSILGNNIWGNCFSMKYIAIPTTCPISSSYFSNCFSLLVATLPDFVTNIGNGTFERCINLRHAVLPANLTAMGQYAFRDCHRLPDIDFPSSLTSINYNAFEMCHSLKKALLPQGVGLGNAVFSACVSLEKVSVSSNISNSCFINCYNLREITLGDGVTSIGSSAFQNCRLLKEIILPGTLTSVGQNAFQNCFSLEKVMFGNGSELSLGNNAFSACYNLTSIDLSNVGQTGTYVFADCYNLEDVILPESMTQISNNMFSGCSNLHSLTIPALVTSIGAYAFSMCMYMRHLYVLPTTPPTANGNFLANTYKDLIIHVPKGTLSAYQAATNWSAFASKMVEMDE